MSSDQINTRFKADDVGRNELAMLRQFSIGVIGATAATVATVLVVMPDKHIEHSAIESYVRTFVNSI